MADGPQYVTEPRRRRERKTDYGGRMDLLKAGVLRAVTRASNNNFLVQFIDYEEEGDMTVASAFSGELEDFGWKGHGGNIPSAYLTGYLAGKRLLEEGFGDAIADTGIKERQASGRYYAALRGVRDSGVNIDVDEDVLPDEERVSGGHLERDTAEEEFRAVRENIESGKDG